MTHIFAAKPWGLRWLKAICAWRTVKDTGVWLYQENAVTGKRRALRTTAGYQPVNSRWLTRQDAEWKDGPRNPPPSGVSGVPPKPA